MTCRGGHFQLINTLRAYAAGLAKRLQPFRNNETESETNSRIPQKPQRVEAWLKSQSCESPPIPL